MSLPIKLTISGAGIASSAAVETPGQITAVRGVAGAVALDASIWVAPQNNATTNGVEVGHVKAGAAATDTLNPGLSGIGVTAGQFILANFVDADANHEVWIYFD